MGQKRAYWLSSVAGEGRYCMPLSTPCVSHWRSSSHYAACLAALPAYLLAVERSRRGPLLYASQHSLCEPLAELQPLRCMPAYLLAVERSRRGPLLHASQHSLQSIRL